MDEVSREKLFKRQITLSEIGEEGQHKLQESKVLVVGCGGLGSPIGVCLAASGIGQLHLVDFDTVDVTNLHRQVFYSLDDVGKYKSEVLADFIQRRAPFTNVTFSKESITKTNIIELISEYDIIIDGTDSLPTKYLLNDICVLQNKPLVYGSLYKFDGYVSVFNLKQENGSFSANLRDAFPVMNTDIPNCEEAGTLNAIVGMIAAAQVNEVLKIITGVGKPLCNQLLIYNALQNSQLKMKLQAKVSKDEIHKIFEKESYYDASCDVQNPDWLISSEELRKKLSFRAESRNLELIAVLPNLTLPFEVDRTIPIQDLDVEKFHINPEKTYIMVCQRGMTSYKATSMLKKRYPEANVISLIGGVSQY